MNKSDIHCIAYIIHLAVQTSVKHNVPRSHVLTLSITKRGGELRRGVKDCLRYGTASIAITYGWGASTVIIGIHTVVYF